MADMILKVEGREYPLDVEATLADLTGAETVMLEEYLGGWDRFNLGSGSTRSVIVGIWLAKHQAGEEVLLAEIEEIKGLIFGDALDLQEMNGGPPDESAAADIPSTPDDSATTGTGD